MMDLMARNFPGVFAGYTLDVVESHQRAKADTSGTARAVVASFRQMGVQFPDVRARVRALAGCLVVPARLHACLPGCLPVVVASFRQMGVQFPDVRARVRPACPPACLPACLPADSYSLPACILPLTLLPGCMRP